METIADQRIADGIMTARQYDNIRADIAKEITQSQVIGDHRLTVVLCCKEMARDHVGRRPRTIRSDYIMNTSTLTFQDHYEMWLHENKQDSEIWTYEKWINDYCFKDFRRK